MTGVDLLLIAAPVAPMLAALAAMPSSRPFSLYALPVAALPGLALGLLAMGAAAPFRMAAPGFLLGVEVGMEPALGAPLAAVALVWGIAALHGFGMASDGPATRRYALFFGVAMAGQMATFVSRDLVSFYVGFAALSFAGYGLVAHRGDAMATRAARIYVAFVVLGELALFAALAMLSAGQDGGLATPADAGMAPPALAYWLLVVGFGVKAGLVPLHAWLPLAHPVAPVPASAALSGATLKAGLVGLLLFAPPAHAPASLGVAVLALGLLGGFGGALLGALQRDAKTALAWSSVSQMGLALVLWGAASAGLAAADLAAVAIGFVIVHHALAKALLFLLVDPGISRRLALVAAVAPALSLTGAPLTLGYAAKTAAQAALGGGVLGTLFAAAAFGTALAMVRALWLTVGKPDAASTPKAGAVLIGLGALLVAPVALGASVAPKDAVATAVALAPAAAAVAMGLGLRRWGWSPPLWATADPLAYLSWLPKAVSAAQSAFDALVRASDAARAGAASWVGGLAARLADAQDEAAEDGLWRLAAISSLAILLSLGLIL